MSDYNISRFKRKTQLMKSSIKKSSINEFLISIFVIVSVIFPGDLFNIKKIIFLVILLFNLRLITNSVFKRENTLFTFFGLVFPTSLILYSTILTNDILISFSRSFAPYIFLLIFVIKYYKIDYEKILLRSISLIMIITLSIVIMDISNLTNANSGFFRDIFYLYDIGIMGKSETYSFYYKVFMKTSPLLVFLLFKKFSQGKYIPALFTIMALVLSGTRANAILPIFFLMIYYIFFVDNKFKIIKYGLVVTSMAFILIFHSNIIAAFNEVLIIKGEQSNLVRVGHIVGIQDLIYSNPLIIIFGSGMGSDFFSHGSNSFTSSIEWSYIDLWRQMGFIFFSIFITFLLLPFFYKNKTGNYKKIAYITYLIIAGTNPLLFSSTGYLAYLYMFYDLQKYKAH